jgi:glycosyltransferase involved in cell wall biosynthesis
MTRRASDRATSPSELVMVVHARYPLGEPRVEREARAARDEGYAVRVICLRHSGELAHEMVDGIDVQRLPVEHRRGIGTFAVLLEYLRFTFHAARELAVRRPPAAGTIIHCHSPPDFIVAAALIPRVRGCRVVLDIHDLSRHIFGARFGSRSGGRILYQGLAAIERCAGAVANRLITVHEPYRQQLVANGVTPEKVTVVMNSADETVIDQVRSRSQVDDRAGDGFVVAYHGTLNPWYGVDLIVEAVALLKDRVPNVAALIIGEGDALDDLRVLARDLGVAERVHFSGRYLPHEEALAAIRTADCGVIPNKPSQLNRFALSNKLLEYVALEIPAVVAALPTLQAHFSPDEVSFFEPDNAAALAAAVARLAMDREAALQMARRAEARARDYSWADNRRRYTELLASLRLQSDA